MNAATAAAAAVTTADLLSPQPPIACLQACDKANVYISCRRE